MTTRRRVLTLAEVRAFNQAHEDRLVIINRPFPILRTFLPGKIWAGNLITHDDDALFLKGQRQHLSGHYSEEETL